ncbi:MAG TPA: hypothetical protein VLW06_13495 [Terriglobales bacterium]|nr:hypothetical protein [Terriglobales bacterium]
MPDHHAEELVRTAVTEALDRQLPSFRETIVQEVLRAVGSSVGSDNGTGVGSMASLQKAISAVQAGATQKEILRALLDNAVLYCGRAALFVVKNGAATGWQAAEFPSNDAVKDFALDVNSGLVARVLQSRTAEDAHTKDFDQQFISKFGAPANGNIALLPLLLKDKVSALIYADSGNGANLDSVALDVLVKATGTWLEVISQRKQAHKDGPAEPEMHSAPPANDPFAAHAPLHSAKAQHIPEPAPMTAAVAAGSGSAAAAAPALSPEEAEIHRKAQRFARLLMDEIKLYNQAKVSEGRKNRDIYDRLKEDIEKSRSTYLKRYGNTSAASANYFNQELIRSLAEDDVSLLGKNFQQ